VDRREQTENNSWHAGPSACTGHDADGDANNMAAKDQPSNRRAPIRGAGPVSYSQLRHQAFAHATSVITHQVGYHVTQRGRGQHTGTDDTWPASGAVDHRGWR